MDKHDLQLPFYSVLIPLSLLLYLLPCPFLCIGLHSHDERKTSGLSNSPSPCKKNTTEQFQIPSAEERDQLIQEQTNQNTIRKTASDILTLQNFISKVKEKRKIEEIPHTELDLLLSNFILSARRQDGKEYEPHTLRCMLGSIDRYLKGHKYPYTIKYGNSKDFPLTKESLCAKMKYLKKKGKDNSLNKAEALTDDDINKLYKSGTFSLENPTSLLNVIFLNNHKHFALRTREHYDLQWGDITLKTDTTGNQYLEYTGCQTKAKKQIKSRIYATPQKPERDPITAYIKYKNSRPNSMTTAESPFYLAPNTSYKSGHSQWYRAMKIGIHKMRTIMTAMKIQASLLESKITPSTSATRIRKLVDNSSLSTALVQISGLKNIQCTNKTTKIQTSASSYNYEQTSINKSSILDTVFGQNCISNSTISKNLYNQTYAVEPPKKCRRVV
ncbi:uncharacterized protein KIAA1958-like [Rhinophrynus dorsalis]